MAEDNFVQLLSRLGEEFKRSEEYVRLKSITKEFQRRLDNGELHLDEFRIYGIIKTVIWLRDEKGLLYSHPKDEKAYKPIRTTTLVTYMPLNWQGHGPRWKPTFFKGLVRNGPWYVALKSIRKKSVNYSGSALDEFLPELNAYYNCSAIINHVPHCFGITKTPEKEYIIVMEYANKGDLCTFLSKSEEYPSWSLHHDEKLYIAVGDLGLCHDINAPNENNQKNDLYGVISYMAPELLRNSKHTSSTDVYSFGMVVYKIASLTEPFYDQKDHVWELAVRICEGE
ncbi:serine/threonine protein kinase [Gigaspora margarita]|uniref:Serine/threonine protein kinase n=1 Tax=Gigaspora margarita TaxID=4874 RepID=A0A8H3X754_GIGMA|nr:serine/threonine protein kinase [Gigaspora margarita]